MAKLRLGIADVLEARPPAWGFLKGHHSDLFEPALLPPRRVGDLLADGALDVGLLPLVELGHLPELTLVPDLCVSVEGRSSAALLLGRGSGPLRRIAVDADAVTQRVLLQILLRDRQEGAPDLVDVRPGLETVPDDCDGLLLRGVTALRARWDPPVTLDLSEEWHRQTGLPLVLWVWAVGAGVETRDLTFYMKSSLRYGLSSLDTVCRETGSELGVRIARLERYLGDEAGFVLGERERAGAETLLRRAREAGLVPEAPALKFV